MPWPLSRSTAAKSCEVSVSVSAAVGSSRMRIRVSVFVVDELARVDLGLQVVLALFDDIDLGVLKDRTVSILGYGNQGRSQALNLRDNGTMGMRHVESLDLSANGSLVLEPGGHHVMLMGVDRLEIGTMVDITLQWENAGDQVIQAEVVSPADTDLGDG